MKQSFYTAYFQTEQAMAWWSTCWSSMMSMTGVAEARCYLGYDGVVDVDKCECDEEKILSRMDGQEGQAKRPLAVAAATINADCPPGGANLKLFGRLNTTLSPSVTGHEPTGIVCEPTPGFVSFDTSMDTTVPPQTVVVAYGGGILINHAWVGDDRISFDVVPIVPWPVIFYDVIESKARSKADRARLDGNTAPPVNAKGPNRDDYVWLTVCPYDGTPWTPHIPTSDPPGPVLPGNDKPVTTALVSHTPEPKTLVCMLTDTQGWYTGGDQVVNLSGEGTHELLIWNLEVPGNILPGTTNTVTLTVSDGDDIQVVETELFYYHPLDIDWVAPPFLTSGESIPIRARIRNLGSVPIELRQFQVFDDAGWSQPLLPIDHDFEPFGELEFDVEFGPVDLLPGEVTMVNWQGEVDGVDVGSELSEVFAGLPLEVRQLENSGFAPGNPNATILIGIENRSSFDLQVEHLAFDAFGFPTQANCPPVLPAQAEIFCEIIVDLPPDPLLIGQIGRIDYAILNSDGFEFLTQLPWAGITGVSVQLNQTEIPMTTGHSSEQAFVHPVELTNLTAQPMQGDVLLATAWPGLPPVQSFFLNPYETQIVNFNIMIFPDTPAETQPGLLDVYTDSGLGDSQQEIFMTLYEPVIVQMGEKGIAGEPGEDLGLGASILNLRWDLPMIGEYQWTDEKGWLTGPLSGGYDIMPNSAESLTVHMTMPGGIVAYADSNVVTLLVSMTYDTGISSESHGHLKVMLLGADDPTGVPDTDGVPVLNRLAGNFPNPFNPRTQVRFLLAEASEIQLAIYDVRGSQIKELASGHWPAGSHELRWDGDNESGEGVASGVYFIRLEIGRQVQTSKAVLVR